MLKVLTKLARYLEKKDFYAESRSIKAIIQNLEYGRNINISKQTHSFSKKYASKNIISPDQVIITGENIESLSPALDSFFENLKVAIANRINFQLVKYYDSFILNNTKGFYDGMQSRHYDSTDKKYFVIKDYDFFKDYFFGMFEDADIVFELTGKSSAGEDRIATNTIGFSSSYMRLDFYFKRLIEIGILDVSDRIENLLSSGFYTVRPDDKDYEMLMSLKYGKSYIEGRYSSEEKFDINFISKIPKCREDISKELNYIVNTINNGDMDYIFFHEISHFKSVYFNDESSSLKDDFVENKHIEFDDRYEQDSSQYDLEKQDLEHVNIYLENIKLLSADKYNSDRITPDILIKIFNNYRGSDNYSYSSGDLKANTHMFLNKLIKYYDSLDDKGRELFLENLAARINSQARVDVYPKTKAASRLFEIKKIAEGALDNLRLEDFRDKEIVSSGLSEKLAEKIDSDLKYKNLYESMLGKISRHLREGCYSGNEEMRNNISLSEYFIIKSFPESLALDAVSLYEKKDSNTDGADFSKSLSEFLSDKFDITPLIDIYGDSNFPYEPKYRYNRSRSKTDGLHYFSTKMYLGEEMNNLMRNEKYHDSFLYKNIAFKIASEIARKGLASVRGESRGYLSCKSFKFPIIMYTSEKNAAILRKSFLDYGKHIRFVPSDKESIGKMPPCKIPSMSMNVYLSEDFFKNRPEFLNLEKAFNVEKSEGKLDDHDDVLNFIYYAGGEYLAELLNSDNFKKEISSLVERNAGSNTYVEYGKFLFSIAKEVHDKKRRLTSVSRALGDTMSVEEIVGAMKKEKLINNKDLKSIQDIMLNGSAHCKIMLLEELADYIGQKNIIRF